jgi:hypothetical protein
MLKIVRSFVHAKENIKRIFNFRKYLYFLKKYGVSGLVLWIRNSGNWFRIRIQKIFFRMRIRIRILGLIF